MLELCTIAVTERGSWRRAGVFLELRELRHSDRIVFFEMPSIGVSSTIVRRRAARGEPIRYLVPDAVRELIESRGLYREEAQVSGS